MCFNTTMHKARSTRKLFSQFGMEKVGSHFNTHATSLGWTGTLTASRASSPNISVGPPWCSCGWMVANLCSKVRVLFKAFQKSWGWYRSLLMGFGMRCSTNTYGCDIRMSTHFWPCSVLVRPSQVATIGSGDAVVLVASLQKWITPCCRLHPSAKWTRR